MTVLLLALSFALLLGGAVLFTNAVEWMGLRLNVGHSATGSLLAAVGTALPESTIPIVALLGGAEGSEDVAIGAIIGAPFMLATVAMLLVALSTLGFRRRRASGRRLRTHAGLVRRDLGSFLGLFGVALLLGLGAPRWLQVAGAVFLLIAYGVYAWRTVVGGGGPGEEEELRPLTLDPSRDDPPTNWQIALQVVVGLGLIVGGSELFVEEIVVIAESLGIGALALALVIAPLATELPEKANSILWIRQGKDSLAVGNITGAMVFQSTIPVSVGLFFTDWRLNGFAAVAAALALAGGAIALWTLRRGEVRAPAALAWAALFSAFVIFVVVAG
ncbi:MAG: sodium:calcium antiporter [Thermoleophilaceae bacterium]|nr:sodium:calcium antiporter [Thermoleophilaceae bacterium]